MKLFLSFVAIVMCWLTPLGDAEYIGDMTLRSGMSLALMMIVLYLSCEAWAIFIGVIEMALIIINSIIVVTWPSETWLMLHYALIQKAAFMGELLIIIGAGADGVRAFISDFSNHLRSIFIGRRNS